MKTIQNFKIETINMSELNMKIKIYERVMGRDVIRVYATENKNQNIFEVEVFGNKAVYTFENIYDSDVFKIIRLFEYNTYANIIDMVDIVNKNCRHLKLKWDCGKLILK